MSAATPPDLPGYEFVRELGQGGFADVFLFRQQLPTRQVAIKVLRRTTQSELDRHQFENEANRMAALSTHPYILTIYEVGVSPAGQPYLTMEYCPHDHFGKIARQEQLSVARALEVGVKVAAAVETAHQSEILHRDIKPANVLMTSYGQPALTDFGIAGGADGDGLADSQGVSIPFAAPEVLNGTTSGDEASDVYSVGATVYALLAGRSPFSTGSPLSEAELMNRVLSAPLPATGRPDVPANLERVLANALHRDPSKRYNSAAAFGRALQAIEVELNVAQTPLSVPESTSTGTVVRRRQSDDDDDGTRLKAMQRIDPDGPSPQGGGLQATAAQPARPRANPTGFAGSAASEQLDARTVQRSSQRPEDASQIPAQDQSYPATPAADGAARRRNRILASLGGAAVLIAILVFIITQAGGDDDTTTTTSTTADTSPLVTASAPQAPEEVTVDVADVGGQVISWTPVDHSDDDSFRVRFTQGPESLTSEVMDTTRAKLRVETDERICVTVSTIRGGRVSAESTEVCTPQ